MKILLVGHPGSGKTYLADLLSEKAGIDKIDIDTLFDMHPLYAIFKQRYQKALQKLIGNKKGWVIDGYHTGLMPDSLFSQADLVVYLNLPDSELKRNIIERQKTKKLAKEFSHWQSFYLNNFKNFWQIRFQEKTLKNDLVRLRKLLPEKSIVELHSREEIAGFCDSFRFTK